LARRYPQFLEAGVRLVAIDVDSPGQHAAMIEKLSLPFPFLSDPDRSLVIEPYGLSNPTDQRNLAYPALVLLDPAGVEVWRWVSRDFADRIPEDEVVSVAQSHAWEATDQPAIDVGGAEPGPKAMPFDALGYYFRGARFAALAMGLRHGHHDESIKNDSKAYVAEMDRFFEDHSELKRKRS
jgi:hypothetical protein